MKKILGSIKRPKNGEVRSNGLRNSVVVPTGDGPEAVIYREVQAFCESGAPGSQSTGDEYLHLPAIVDAAESSPSAANQAAVRIRNYLGKDHYERGFAQYNAIMLTRILTDNPGPVFTQNFDKEFISTVKKLLRDGKDSSVQQILRETLDYLEVKSNDNITLKPLIEMWRKEKGNTGALVYPRSGINNRAPPMPPRPRGLPPPDELAGRIEEAKTTARLLVQTIQSTPIHELLANDLVREFADRARSAQKSVQTYMNAENPHPDDDTMLTLIETSEQLNVAITKHSRAVLQARRAAGATPSPQPQDKSRTDYMGGGENVYGHSPALQPQQPVPQQWSEQQFQPKLTPPVINGQGRSSPRNEHFSPPPGPPPGHTANSVYSNYQTKPSTYNPPKATNNYQSQATTYNTPPASAPYQSFNGPIAQTNVSPAPPQQPGYHAHTASKEFNVADNPFTDAAGYDQPTPQQKYSLFSRESGQTQREGGSINSYDRSNADNPNSQSQSSTQHRPGAYDQGFTSTPSYIHRQDSAAAHATMHGASPPTDAQR